VDPRLDAGLRARRVDDDVDASSVGRQAQSVAAEERVCVLLRRERRVWDEGFADGLADERLCDGQLVLVHIHRDDPARAELPRDCRAEDTDRAGAKHDDLVAGLHAHLACGVDPHGERFEQHGLVEPYHLRVDLEAVILGQLEVFGQRPVVVGRAARELHLRAEVVAAGLAAGTSAAGVARFEGDVVARA